MADYPELLSLLGARDVQIFDLNKRIEELEKKLLELAPAKDEKRKGPAKPAESPAT